MDKQQFKDFCKKEFLARGFKKQKNAFWLAGDEVLCSLHLQKSDYGPNFYINCFYYVGNFKQFNTYPPLYDDDLRGRISVLSKSQKVDGKCFRTPLIAYEEYTEEEMKPYFDKAFEDVILPALEYGKAYILKFLRVKYHLTMYQEEVMRKLQS